MEIRIELRENVAGCTFYIKEVQVHWEDLTIEEKKRIVNALAELYNLFKDFI